MLLTHVLDEPCPTCGIKGKFGRVNVTRNRLFRGCNACNYREHLPLPQLRKRVIYLDQNFLSHAFRRGTTSFVDAANKIKALAQKQLVVCPWSNVHEIESHIWRDTRAKDLWEFIKQTARGHKFKQPSEIKLHQAQRLFDLAQRGQPFDSAISRADGLDRDIDDWDDYFWIDVGRFTDDPERVRVNRARSHDQLISALAVWRANPKPFEAELLEEAAVYARDLWLIYVKWMQACATGSIDDMLNASDEVLIVQGLMARAAGDDDFMGQARRVAQFLGSAHFRATPYLDIASRLFAVLRKLARAGRGDKRHAGVFGDINAVATYAPYCDAVFLDREMRRWTLDDDGQIARRYGFKVFSAETWAEFDDYLAEIDQGAAELSPDLAKVYG